MVSSLGVQANSSRKSILMSGHAEGLMLSLMSDNVESLTWLTDPHLEFCGYRTRHQLYDSINQEAGEIVLITGDLSAGSHRLAQYTELAEQIKKGQFKTGKFGKRKATMSELWNAAFAA